MVNNRYNELITKLQEIHVLNSTAGILHWDQAVHLPANGHTLRGLQIQALSALVHEKRTADSLWKLAESLMADVHALNPTQQCNVRETYTALEKTRKLSAEFVSTLSQTTTEAFGAWVTAKQSKDFKVFAPVLGRLIDLKKQEIEALYVGGHPYDTLMDSYEPGITCAQLDPLFERVSAHLVPFVKSIVDAGTFDNPTYFEGNFDVNIQAQFGKALLEHIGFNFQSGNMGVAPHPFCMGLIPGDVRVTYKVNPNQLAELIWGLIHEGGHALYEQNLPASEWGTPAGMAASLAMHESQSRFWENNIGRSLGFWEGAWPIVTQYFPDWAAKTNPEAFFKACNHVSASPIRIEADELTYHFHIMIRYEIEKALFGGTVKLEELPELWNSLYKSYLGIEITNDAEGILQDVHWSHGSFGYFPTYSLGSFYAAQFADTIHEQVISLNQPLQTDALTTIRTWLNTHIHQKGMQFKANVLCELTTGESLQYEYFKKYVTQKYTAL